MGYLDKPCGIVGNSTHSSFTTRSWHWLFFRDFPRDRSFRGAWCVDKHPVLRYYTIPIQISIMGVKMHGLRDMINRLTWTRRVMRVTQWTQC